MHEWLSGPPAGPAEARPAPLLRLLPVLADLWIVAVWFLVVGVVGALIWWQVTPLAAYTRTKDNGTMDEAQLAKQISTDGWFFVVALVGGLLSGFVLLSWRRRGPILMVLAVCAGGFLAFYVMRQVGLWVGPADPTHVLRTISVGQKAPLRLKPQSHGLLFIWPLASMAGAVVGLIGAEFLASRKRHQEDMQRYREMSAAGQFYTAGGRSSR
jgi:hypothetical protein